MECLKSAIIACAVAGAAGGCDDSAVTKGGGYGEAIPTTEIPTPTPSVSNEPASPTPTPTPGCFQTKIRLNFEGVKVPCGDPRRGKQTPDISIECSGKGDAHEVRVPGFEGNGYDYYYSRQEQIDLITEAVRRFFAPLGLIVEVGEAEADAITIHVGGTAAPENLVEFPDVGVIHYIGDGSEAVFDEGNRISAGVRFAPEFVPIVEDGRKIDFSPREIMESIMHLILHELGLPHTEMPERGRIPNSVMYPMHLYAGGECETPILEDEAHVLELNTRNLCSRNEGQIDSAVFVRTATAVEHWAPACDETPDFADWNPPVDRYRGRDRTNDSTPSPEPIPTPEGGCKPEIMYVNFDGLNLTCGQIRTEPGLNRFLIGDACADGVSDDAVVNIHGYTADVQSSRLTPAEIKARIVDALGCYWSPLVTEVTDVEPDEPHNTIYIGGTSQTVYEEGRDGPLSAAGWAPLDIANRSNEDRLIVVESAEVDPDNPRVVEQSPKDVFGTAVHEGGHAMGLGHTEYPGSYMGTQNSIPGFLAPWRDWCTSGLGNYDAEKMTRGLANRCEGPLTLPRSAGQHARVSAAMSVERCEELCRLLPENAD